MEPPVEKRKLQRNSEIDFLWTAASRISERYGVTVGNRYKHLIVPEQHYDVVGECWIWRGAKNKKGYGVYTNPQTKKTSPAHKVVYEKLVGPVPNKYHLDHVKERCNSRACINPAHLEPVTGTENTRRSSLAKITMSDAIEIRESYNRGEKQNSIATRFNITQGHVSDIVNNYRWA